MIESRAVLGLSIGTRKIGAAVIKNNHLECARVFVFAGRWSEIKLQRMLRKIKYKVYKYHIDSFSLKIPPSSHHTIGLKALIKAIKEYCKDRDITLHICTFKELKAHRMAEEIKNKKMLVQALGNKYPQLYFKAKKEQANRNMHHTRMFEAVAAAELLTEQLNKVSQQ